MHRQKGFSLVEVMISMAILLVVIGATLSTLTDALHANEAVTGMADMQDNLRAGMNLMVRDIVQAGSGIPIGGVPIPYTDPANNPTLAPIPLPINRPSPPLQAYTFPVASVISAITPGYQLGPASLGQKTDMITVIYADNELAWNSMAPVNNTVNPNCVLGKITTTTITFDTTTAGCAPNTVTNGNVAVLPGDLLMLTNGQGGNIVEEVTTVAGNVVTFGVGIGNDYQLNGQAAASGTIVQMETPLSAPVTFPATSVTRLWMISYFLDTNTNPQRPQLMRQVNFRQAYAVGQVMEGLQVSYDVVNAVATAPANNARQIIAPDSPNQIRKVNLYMAARSETPYSVSKQYFRNNLVTQVGIRSLSFQNLYN
jgi:prepilin-type N-terminal cleavage/methylation domain-containing protein